MATKKAEETQRRILNAALELFREQGFEQATMREIAARAGVATGAAYYYFPSKEAIVMAFYERSCAEMQPLVDAALASAERLEARLRELIRVKLAYFGPSRPVLRTFLRNGADPKHPISPFSEETKVIRQIDFAWFAKLLEGSGTRVPRDLAPELPGLLWMFQMGVILFWVTDDSPRQERSERLLELGCKIVATLVRLSGLPLMRPVRKVALELIAIVKGE
jgi:AcrR family transcriptional regulator